MSLRRGAAWSSRALVDEPLLPVLLRLAGPTMLAQAMQMAYQLIDTYWLARLGTSAVAAVAITFPMSLMLIALGGGVAVAGSTFISQHHGAHDPVMVGKTAAQTLIMTLGAAVITTVLGLVLAAPVLGLLGAPKDIRALSLGFLHVSFTGTVFTFLFAAAQALQRGIGDVMTPLFIITGAVAMNMVVAPLFIFGAGPIHGGGVTGAAWSNVTSQFCAAAAACALLLTRRFGLGLTCGAFRPDWNFIRKTVSVAVPASLEQSTAALNFMVLMGLVTSFGTLAVATYGIGLRILSMAMIPAFGLAMATATLVGQSIGAGNRPKAFRTVVVGIRSGAVMLGLIGAGSFVLSPYIAHIFAPQSSVLEANTTLYVRITAMGYVFMAGNQVFLGALRGSGATRTSMAIAMVQSWLLQLPAAYLLSKHTPLGMTGLWASTVVKEVLITGVSTVIFLRGRWLRSVPTVDDRRRVDLVSALPDEELMG